MGALVRMRLAGFVRTGRAFAPLVAVLIVLSTLYGGGQSQATHDVVYAVAAALLVAALLCALVGAAVASMARSGLRG